MPKGGCDETLRMIYGHLLECERCRQLAAVSQRVERSLAIRKLRLNEIAERDPITKDRIFAGTERSPIRRACWPRALRAGAAAGIALLLAVAAVHYLGDNGKPPLTPVPPRPRLPVVTRAMAEEASCGILERLARAELRHQPPPLRLPSGPPEAPWEPPRSRLFEKCSLDSARTLVRIAESQTNLTWRNGS